MTHPPGDGRGHVLVVEDDAGSRRALVNVLTDQGYRVTAAENGAEALQFLIGARPPDLIILDLMMPEMDGWDFRHEQKRHERLAPIPVIGISAVGKLVDADLTLRKPLDYDELVAAVHRFVGGSRDARQ